MTEKDFYSVFHISEVEYEKWIKCQYFWLSLVVTKNLNIYIYIYLIGRKAQLKKHIFLSIIWWLYEAFGVTS